MAGSKVQHMQAKIMESKEIGNQAEVRRERENVRKFAALIVLNFVKKKNKKARNKKQQEKKAWSCGTVGVFVVHLLSKNKWEILCHLEVAGRKESETNPKTSYY